MLKYGAQFNLELEIGLAHGYSVEDQVRIISDYYKYIKVIQNSDGVIN